MKTIYYDGDIITMTGARDSCEALVTEDKKSSVYWYIKIRRRRFTEKRHRNGI